MTAPKMICPVHHTRLSSGGTRFGKRWACDVPGCDVLCWEGRTSTPADQATRTLRNALHRAFDPLWEDPAGPFCRGQRPNKRGVRRSRAYRWLSEVVHVDIDDAHFGMFTLQQCKTARDAMAAFGVKVEIQEAAP